MSNKDLVLQLRKKCFGRWKTWILPIFLVLTLLLMPMFSLEGEGGLPILDILLFLYLLVYFYSTIRTFVICTIFLSHIKNRMVVYKACHVEDRAKVFEKWCNQKQSSRKAICCNAIVDEKLERNILIPDFVAENMEQEDYPVVLGCVGPFKILFPGLQMVEQKKPLEFLENKYDPSADMQNL